jgi:thiazole synthase
VPAPLATGTANRFRILRAEGPGSSGNRAERPAYRTGDPKYLIQVTLAKGDGAHVQDPLLIADRSFSSRLIVGTGKFGSFEVMRDAIEASGTEIVTVALRRVDLEATGGPDILEFIDPDRYLLLPNTSGAVDADEAVRIARLARAAGMPAWVKLEVTPEPRYLLPDPVETLRAAERLVAEGFTVLPYINADPVLAKRLEEAGCATVMPLGSWIGSNQGVRTRDAVRIIVEQATVPVVVDAGLGAPSHAAEAMEMGADAVLVNTAIAVAHEPVAMARAFKAGVEAGRMAWAAGRAPERIDAEASSPLTGFLDKLHTSQADPAVTEP